MRKLLLVSGLACAIWAGPTLLKLSQLQAVVYPPASVTIVQTDGTLKQAVLDGTSLYLDLSTTPPTLRARIPAATALKTEAAVRQADGTYVLSAVPTTLVLVTRNGIVQAVGSDFNAAGKVITFIGGVSQVDDVVLAVYQ